jgi:cytochrome P450
MGFSESKISRDMPIYADGPPKRTQIQRILDANWSQFNSLAQRKGTINMADWAQYFAYDVVSELALGRAFGMVKTGSDVGGYIKSVVGSFYFTANLGHIPGQRAWLTSSFAQLPIKWFGTESLKGNANFRKFVNDAVTDRYYAKTAPDSADMLQHFIEAKTEDGSRGHYETVRGEAAIVLAGADTTSIALSSPKSSLIRTCIGGSNR